MATRAAPRELDAWLARALGDEPPRASSLVVTLFGDAIAPHGGAVWLGGLIDALAVFGVSERLVRTSVFRLGEDGWLESRREGRQSLYTLGDPGRRRLALASRRVYAPPSHGWDGEWTLVLVPRAAVGARTALRRELEWEGFAAVAPGVFAHPRADRESLDDALARSAGGDAVVFAARDAAATSGRPAAALVASCWRLESLAADYGRFIERFEPLAATIAAAGAPTPRHAFAARTLLVHSYRRVVLDDPWLPSEMLPANWPGHAAFALCRALYSALLSPSESYLVATLRGPTGALPPASRDLRERFGGV